MNPQADIIRDISFLYELALSVGRTLDLKENCANFVKTIIRRKNLSFASVWLDRKEFGEEGNIIELIYAQPEFHISEKAISHEHPICGILSNNPVISCAYGDDTFEKVVQQSGVDKGAYAVFRLGRMGYLKLYDSNRTEPFTKVELNQLRQVIEGFTISIEACIAHGRFKESNEALIAKERSLKSVNDFVASLLNCGSVAEVLEAISKSVTQSFGFPNCFVYLKDSKTGEFISQGNTTVQRISPENGVIGRTIRLKRSQNVGRTDKDKDYYLGLEKGLSELVVPIFSEGEVLGVIDTVHPEAHFFTQEHEETLTSIASLAATRIRDTTSKARRIEAETALRDSEARIRAIINSALDAVITIDESGSVTAWNQQAADVFGWTYDEIIGKTLSDTIIPHVHRKGHDSGMKNFLKTGEGPVLNNRIEIVGLRKSGEVFPIELAIVPIKLEKEWFFSAFVRDITEKKAIEERQEKLLTKLEAANKELRDFAYVVSHDLKAPLRAIGSLTQWIAEDYADKFDDDGRQQLSLLTGRVARMRDLINGILDYSQAGRTNQKVAAVDLHTVLTDVVDLLGTDGEKAVTIVGEYPSMMLNQVSIQQIFMNLISNAIKYSDKEDCKVEVGCEKQETDWVFWVKDNGPGIDPKYHDKIFRIFQTLSARDKVEATGIGLAIVRKMVHLFGGKIWVESTVNEGATFLFTLPQHSEAK
ncbi:MAG: ATP-binding protein [Bacteroidia bacterium]